MRSRQREHGVFVGFQQLHGQADQVVEIDRVECGQALPGSARTARRLRARARSARLRRPAPAKGRRSSRAKSGSSPRRPRPACCPAAAGPSAARCCRRHRRSRSRGAGRASRARSAAASGPSAWKVQIVRPSAASPLMRLATRSRISRADLLVKVIAAMRRAGMRPEVIRCAIFSTITRVLPLPAPASTSSGPSTCSDGLALGRIEAVQGTLRGQARGGAV